LKGFYKKAQEMLEKSLEVLKEIYQGQERPEMATVLYYIAQQQLNQGAYDQALQQCTKALNLYKKVSYPSHFLILQKHNKALRRAKDENKSNT
jgi:tetratricopeptide (TPR) repeat protein